MKLYFVLFLFITFLSCNKSGKLYDSFGEVISDQEAVPLKEVKKSVNNDTTTVKLTATIDEVCQMKGCWMTLRTDDGSRVRVTFKDYGFFVPKDASGREVIVQGTAVSTRLDTVKAMHYAEDAGKEFDPVTDLDELSIVAEGVLIRKK